jgi:hypothetical protein
MFTSPLHRRLATAALMTAAWIVFGAAGAFAKVAPDDPGSAVTPSQGLPVPPATAWSQLALISAAACLIGVAATLAIQLVVRRSHRPFVADA